MESSRPRSDLEDRTFRFAQDVRRFVRALPRSATAVPDGMQLIRSSGSVGANYIEAQEALSKKDFALRIKICRKEAKESHFWLRLLKDSVPDTAMTECTRLSQEAMELLKIFSAIIQKMRQ